MSRPSSPINPINDDALFYAVPISQQIPTHTTFPPHSGEAQQYNILNTGNDVNLNFMPQYGVNNRVRGRQEAEDVREYQLDQTGRHRESEQARPSVTIRKILVVLMPVVLVISVWLAILQLLNSLKLSAPVEHHVPVLSLQLSRLRNEISELGILEERIPTTRIYSTTNDWMLLDKKERLKKDLTYLRILKQNAHALLDTMKPAWQNATSATHSLLGLLAQSTNKPMDLCQYFQDMNQLLPLEPLRNYTDQLAKAKVCMNDIKRKMTEYSNGVVIDKNGNFCKGKKSCKRIDSINPSTKEELKKLNSVFARLSQDAEDMLFEAQSQFEEMKSWKDTFTCIIRRRGCHADAQSIDRRLEPKNWKDTFTCMVRRRGCHADAQSIDCNLEPKWDNDTVILEEFEKYIQSVFP